MKQVRGMHLPDFCISGSSSGCAGTRLCNAVHHVSNRRKFQPQSALAGHSRITFSSFDPALQPVFTHQMCWIPFVLAGTSLLALPQPLAAPRTVTSPTVVALASHSAQTGSPEGNLPASRYLELRRQTLTHARLIAGPRLKNPSLATGGLARSIAMALSEQRANLLNRAGFASPPAGITLFPTTPPP